MVGAQRTWWRDGRVRLVLLAVILLVLFVVERQRGWDDTALLRSRVEAAGAFGGLVFMVGYAVLCLLPAPKAVLTVLGGVLYGWWLGALLSWSAALLGACIAFAVGRLAGRDVVDRKTGGRVERVDRSLAEHGFAAVLAARLVPVLPFTVLNYIAGVTAVTWRPYLAGSALGMVPGSLAYAALGAWGTDPWGLFAGAAALLLLVVAGGLVGRRLLGGEPRDASSTSGDEP